MKRFSIFIFLLASISSFGQELKIPQYVQNYLEANKLERADVYKVLNPNESKFIKNDSTKSISDKESMFFIDETPSANWGHPCRYVTFDVTGDVKNVAHDNKYPYECELYCIKRDLSRNGEYPFAKKSQLAIDTLLHYRTGGESDHNYAVIINAVWNRRSNYKRYWNDCSEIYRTLINVYGYQKEKIYVIMSDGTDNYGDRRIATNDCPWWWSLFHSGVDNDDCNDYDSSPLDLDNDGVDDIQYPMLRSSMDAVFENLANTLTEDDNLFVYVTGHGDTNLFSATGNVPVWWGIALWYPQSYSSIYNLNSTEFASYLNDINAGTISVIMENCYSGGFIPELTGPNRVVMTACAANEASRTLNNQDYQYNEFVYYWTAAMAGHYPSGLVVNADSNNDGHVSMYEAFQFAKTHDQWVYSTDPELKETPQYYSSTPLLGHSLDLNGVFCHTENIHNKTFNADTLLRSCKFNLDNVVVKTGKDVTFEFIEDVNIHPLTHFEQGSTVHIKPVSSILLEYSPDLLFSLGETVDSETYPEVELKKFDIVQNEEESVLDDNGEEIQMKLYPNPAKSTIFVKSDLIQQIEIFDIVGVKMSCTAERNDQFWKLDVSKLPEGQYFLKISTISGNSISKTFIKQ